MDFSTMSLLEFIPALSPQFQPPYHLRTWCEMIEGCLKGGVRGLCAVPIRHHKTWTTLHGVAWLLVRDPTMRIIILCADHDRAQELGKMCRRLCEAAGIGPARGDNTIVDWKNDKGGGVCTMSAEQSRLGRDVDVLLFDDPIGSPVDADDPKIRDAVDHAIAHYTARAGRPGRRGSILGVMSPWHPDDPLGRRLGRKAETWTYVRHPVIEDMGLETERAFAADVMTLEEIKKRRNELAEVDPSERLFWAQFMCEPRAGVDARFGEPRYYQELPTYGGFRFGMGIDLAYNVGEGDHFALWLAKFYGSIAYVVEVERARADFYMLENMIRNRWDRFGRCPIFSYISGVEKGSLRYFADKGIQILGIPARYSKSTRAQKTIDRWNAGKILLPFGQSWVSGFVARCKMFTGHEKARDDDEIDAMVSACDGMGGSATGEVPYTLGSPRL